MCVSVWAFFFSGEGLKLYNYSYIINILLLSLFQMNQRGWGCSTVYYANLLLLRVAGRVQDFALLSGIFQTSLGVISLQRFPSQDKSVE